MAARDGAPRTALATVLSEANARSGAPRSARALSRAAQERGHTMNHDTAARYLRGDHGRPDEATLVAFADVLDVPLSELRRAADLPDELTTPYQPPAEASRLTRRQRLAVDEIIRAMLDTRGESAREDTPHLRAARRGDPEPPE